MTQPTILFLDIDGVLTMMDCPDLPMERVGGIHCRPVPMANALLKAIQYEYMSLNIDPVWLTSWDKGAQIWNERAGTHHWTVAYHLTDKGKYEASAVFPDMTQEKTDKKLIAARYYLWRTYSDEKRVAWIEDGFAPETVAWANERNNKIAETILIDTTKEPIRSDLLSTYEDYEQAAKTFMGRYVL